MTIFAKDDVDANVHCTIAMIMLIISNHGIGQADDDNDNIEIILTTATV